MHVFKISVGQKVVGQTSWLAHWEQKVGGQLPPCPIGSANARQTVPKAQKMLAENQ